MKIAVLTSGILPVPAVLGGAVENLIDYYLEYNNQHHLHDIMVYSIAPPKGTPNSDTSHTHYHYIDTTSWWGRLKRHIYVRTHKSVYYNQYIEYFFYEALKDIAKKEYDIIILENRPGYAIPLSQVNKAKIILHLHTDILNINTPNAKEIINELYQIITVSYYLKKQVDLITPNQITKVIYNGIDLNKFTHITSSYNRNQFNLKKDDFVVVYTGRIVSIKGILELIKAILLLNKYPHIKLLIVGEINKKDNYFQKIYKLSQDSSQIIFTGKISYENIPNILKIADIGIIPSICEDALTMSSIECLASGLPVIATNSGGIPEVVDDECGIIVQKDNLPKLPELLAEAIYKLYSNEDKRIKMSEKGKIKANLFSKTKYNINMISIFNHK